MSEEKIESPFDLVAPPPGAAPRAPGPEGPLPIRPIATPSHQEANPFLESSHLPTPRAQSSSSEAERAASEQPLAFTCPACREWIVIDHPVGYHGEPAPCPHCHVLVSGPCLATETSAPAEASASSKPDKFRPDRDRAQFQFVKRPVDPTRPPLDSPSRRRPFNPDAY
ncbi:MAG: hypothetical protein AAF555_04890 [Verrucomicrobiota bacterium]